MLDFLRVSTRTRKGVTEVYPKFVITSKSEDLMIQGGDFYAVWIEDLGVWSTEEDDAFKLIDRELKQFAAEHESAFEGQTKIMYMWDGDSGMADKWHKYCQRQMRDRFHPLDEKLIFADSPVDKKDYSSKRLSYALVPQETPAYDELMSVLYSEKERHKLEWCIGSIVTGDSKTLQKFAVLYGDRGTGKSTVLNIIQDLFKGYYATFNAEALGSGNDAFALEPFRDNPLVAIQHDGDLSRIENNARLNSLVSHEELIVNIKHKNLYSTRFHSFLFLGTNKPVKITDAKSGLLRRLIDITPTGKKVTKAQYRKLTKQIKFELGGIACHCRDVYKKDPDYYDDYVPTSMLGATNDFYNYILDSYPLFHRQDDTTLKQAWSLYKTYNDEAMVKYPYPQRVFKEELKNYFWEFSERQKLEDGSWARSYYKGFRTDKFDGKEAEEETPNNDIWLKFECKESLFDKMYENCPAQYAKKDGSPKIPWDDVSTKLLDLDTTKLHYIRPPIKLICIDFDLKGPDGEKSFDLNLEAASKWPATYAELSKSGKAIHLYYIYTGDTSRLSSLYDVDIEVKVFNGKAALRRKLSLCNDIPITTISSGLPLKEEKKVLNNDTFRNERSLRLFIKRNLNKEYHANTAPSIDFINKGLEDMYASGKPYDVTDMRSAILQFAAQSTNQAQKCIKVANKMKFKSETLPDGLVFPENDPLIFFDCEVFPNLFLVCWKIEGDYPVISMVNPKPKEIEELLKKKLIGFNCRRYDNHMLYACMLGYSTEQLYDLSQKIIGGEKDVFFSEAYNASFTDIYDFSSKKQSLKKFEIELGISHMELGLPWDQPVPEELWDKVAEYCENDVKATEAVFNARKADFLAREILADVAGMTVNDTTNSLTTRIIFGTNRNPQSSFNYRNMGCKDNGTGYVKFDDQGRPLFPGYRYDFGVSTYRDEEVGEGGYVYSEPGMYSNVALLDIASMHPSSIVAEELFGPEYTARFKEILDARIYIKHGDFDKAREMLGGKLAKYLTDEKSAKDLAQALKIAINSVYGLTSAKFDNPFRDIRNKDNIVAKRGALFMINLKHEVQERGFTVAHIKTDSIKIPNATPEIIQFVMDFGKQYGYNFEHEATYEKMCLVNDAVYIAKYPENHEFKLPTGEKLETPWTATGTQFQVPFVFKTLFSHDPIVFKDMCETKSVTTALYLDMNEDLPEDEHNYQFIGKVSSFCPIKPGCGGGVLVREGTDKDGNKKYTSATGAKDYRWLESGLVESLGLQDSIDISYYRKQVDEAIEDIRHYGDFEWFVN